MLRPNRDERYCCHVSYHRLFGRENGSTRSNRDRKKAIATGQSHSMVDIDVIQQYRRTADPKSKQETRQTPETPETSSPPAILRGACSWPEKRCACHYILATRHDGLCTYIGRMRAMTTVYTPPVMLLVRLCLSCCLHTTLEGIL